MEEKNATPDPQGSPDINLEQIVKECLDSPGYVIFAGVLSRDRDEKGFNTVTFRYRRYNFAFEDTRKAVEVFKQEYEKDVAAL